MPNQQFHLRDNAFYVGIPKSWDWFFMRNHQRIVFFQDSIHLCTKLRNRLLSSKATMLFGDKLISIGHILQLIGTSSKLNHNLVKSDVLPKDRQNFVSCEKISNEVVLNDLTSIPAFEATKIYLEIIRNIRYAFINKDTNYIDRIHYAWRSVFLIRFWYTWLSTKTKSELDSTIAELLFSQAHKKKNTKQQYFITLPAMFSIEINSHILVYLALLVIQHKLPTTCLNVPIFNSQTCESTFRSCRAMSGPFSSIVNFTVHQFSQRVKKLSFLNSIRCQANHSNANDSNNKFLFPRHHKQSRTIDSKQISSITSTSIVELTVEALENAILQAYSYASRLVCHVNMYEQHHILSLRKMSKLASFQLQKSRIVDYSHLNQHDPDFDSDSDDSSDEEDEDTTGNGIDKEDSTEDDDNYVSDHLFKVSSTTFQGMRVFDSINPTLAKSYFIININGAKKYLHKQTAA
ncbi:unnamed protein product [Rotaria magnacalcarata]|uniref:Uncharacterized protein n=3 Tax=Rotaria magnacalcarata TaxID=392030 RepID=A0A814IRL3_9BILA|nr:unnamed protein product [Rotaria magnacalcarata]